MAKYASLYNHYNSDSVNVLPVQVQTLSTKKDIDDFGKEIKRLQEQGFTRGLAKALFLTKLEFPLRIWVVDNSGSMNVDDGRRIVSTKQKNDVRIVKCTRWAEIQECAHYHIQMAAMMKMPTRFRLLNNVGVGSQYFSVAEEGNEQDSEAAISIIQKARPAGVTPLTDHILAVHHQISEMAPTLKSQGQKVVVIVATDGLPSDDQGRGGPSISEQFVQALRMLNSLQVVWIVIRLCTNERGIVQFYEKLDTNLELSVKVLDDFLDEAKEVFEHNPWLNYGLPLHRCREMGFHDRILDLIDQRSLTKGEISHFCHLLFGDEEWDGVPDPNADWTGFTKHVAELSNRKDDWQWNPISNKVEPWIDVRMLHRMYGHGSHLLDPSNILYLSGGIVLLAWAWLSLTL